MNENQQYHETHCIICGKTIFWALLFNKVLVFKTGLVAHEKCYRKYQEENKNASRKKDSNSTST